jgi:hypothetical protein
MTAQYRLFTCIKFPQTILGLCCTLLFAFSTSAQDATPESGSALAFGTQVVGELDSATPAAEYVFEGLRGDVVTISLDVTSGDLDPMLTLIDASGDLLATRDDAVFGVDGHGIRVESLRLSTSGVYRLVVGRFGYGVGSTEGSYRLTLERVGASSSSGSALRYGDSVINNITDSQPQLYYSFRARRGDLVAIQMQRVSGDLDPVLQLVNQRSFLVAESDDVLGSGSQNAQITGLIIEEDGTYVIIASRYGHASGRSTGSFVLSLDATDVSGMGANALAAIETNIGDILTGELTDERYQQFYRFEGRRGDQITISMIRRDNDELDPLVVLMSGALQELTSNDDSFGTQNATIENFTLPTDGTYYIVATRYQRANGTTDGAYTLELDSASGGFTTSPTATPLLEYGSSVSGVINDATPQVVYGFAGNIGETVMVTMTRIDGNLDPHVSILDGELREIASDDDSGGDRNARIERFTLPASGIFFIQASRFSGEGLPTSGGYVLVISQRFD